MTAWLSRAGAAPLALRPVLPGCAYGPRARKCDGTAPATQEGERAALKARGRNKISYIYRCNSRIGGGRWGRLGGGRSKPTSALQTASPHGINISPRCRASAVGTLDAARGL